MAQVPATDEQSGVQVPFVDCRNGWGLTALHIAVFQGATNTGESRMMEAQDLLMRELDR